jgi:hypothetical protein
MANSGVVPRTPRRVDTPFTLRLVPELAAEVRANAAAARRSIAKELELYVEEALERRRREQEQRGGGGR